MFRSIRLKILFGFLFGSNISPLLKQSTLEFKQSEKKFHCMLELYSTGIMQKNLHDSQQQFHSLDVTQNEHSK